MDNVLKYGDTVETRFINKLKWCYTDFFAHHIYQQT
ncbi:GLP_516_24861_27293 (fragment) [Xenorhabdus nematophila F1]